MFLGLVEVNMIIFICSYGISWLHYQRNYWFGKWKPLTLRYNATKIGSYKPCASQLSKHLSLLSCDIMKLPIKGHMTLWVESFQRNTFCAMFDAFKSCRSCYLTFSFYHETLLDYMIKWTSDSESGSSSL